MIDKLTPQDLANERALLAKLNRLIDETNASRERLEKLIDALVAMHGFVDEA